METETLAAPAKAKAGGLKLPELKPDEKIVAPIRVYAANLIIKTPEGYQQAAQRLVDLKAEIDRVEAEKDGVFKPINAGLRAFSALVKRALDPLKAHEITIKAAMIKYSDEQDRLQRETQRIANEKADKERAKLLEKADVAVANGKESKAEALVERAAAVQAPIVPVGRPMVSGISIPKVWVFEITDESLIPREYLLVDEVRIRKVVTALKGDTRIPGIRAFEQKRISAGAA